jgi:hypothetical protein
MTKAPLKSLAGAAVLLLLSAHIASAGPDGTCEDYNHEETVASEAPAQSTPVPTAAADYTKIAEAAPAAGDSVTITASAKTDTADASAYQSVSDY